MDQQQPAGGHGELELLADRVQLAPADLASLEQLARKLRLEPRSAPSLVDHPAPLVRILALSACGESGRLDAGILAAAAIDAAPGVRAQAASLLPADRSAPAALQRLYDLLGDPEESVAGAAAATLAASLPGSELATLVAHVAGSTALVHQQAMAGLQARRSAAPPELVAAAARPEDALRLPAIEALGAILCGCPTDDIALAVVVDALAADEPRARRWAARALAARACAGDAPGLPAQVVEHLLRALDVAPSFEEQQAVLEALARSGAPFVEREITGRIGSRGPRFDEVALDTVALIQRLRSLSWPA